jgi:hypothetical protein
MRCHRCNEWIYKGFERELNGKYFHQFCEVRQRIADRQLALTKVLVFRKKEKGNDHSR